VEPTVYPPRPNEPRLEERGVPLAKTGVLAVIPWFVAAAATVLGGWMFDRWLNDRPRRVIVPSMLVTAVFLWFMTQSQTAGEFVGVIHADLRAPTATVVRIHGGHGR
jgi:hypothetical protein